MHTARLLALALPLALAAGCDVRPRPAVAKAPEPAAKDPAHEPQPGDVDYQSQSYLGKARDAAVRTKAKIDDYQEQVAKQADEVFKKP